MSGNKPEVAPRVARISQETYALLEKKATSVLPVVPESDLQAGMKIGIEHVLRMLREDITIGA